MSGLDELVAKYDATRRPSNRGTFCHAPFVNLNFDQSGNATACCYNRRFVLGSYPRHALQEIWSGPRVKELRELIAKPDLSHGCDLCQHQLEAGNYSGLRARSYDAVSRAPEGPLWPRLMEFEISNLCNLECVMCNGFFFVANPVQPRAARADGEPLR